MSLPRFLCLWLAAAALAAAADWRLPLAAGTVTGELSPFGAEGPRLRWRIDVRAPSEAVRALAFAIEGEGLALRGRAEVDAATRDGTWALDESTAEASPWFALLAPRLGPAAAGLEAAGRLTLAGGGTLAAGVPAGRVQARLSGGGLRSAADDWELRDIAAEGNFDLEGRGDLAVEVAAVRYGLWTMRDGRVGLTLGAQGTASVTRVRIEGLGGSIELDPFTFAWARPEAALTLRLGGLALQELVALLPAALAEARGRVDGQVALHWDAAGGFTIGAGWIGLAGDEGASVRLAAMPGLITAQIPESNPAYAPLQRVELGRTPLNVQVLRAEFFPQGDGRGRTASVRLQAEPADPGLKAPVVIDINVAGPLDQLIRLGMDERVRFGGGR